jgi:hypothetical protein
VSSAVSAVGRGIKRLVQIVVALVVVVALYYAVGGHLVHRIDAEPSFAEDVAPPEGGSTLVTTMAELVRREVDTHGWVANDPIVFPSALLDDMASYQRGLVAATRAMTDRLADRATGEAASELQAARDGLAFPPDRWTFDFTSSFAPQKATEQAYREAADALARFNAALAVGDADLGDDASVVRDLVAEFAATLEAVAAAGLDYVDARGGHWLDTGADERFQETRAALYTRFLFLRALAADHRDLFADGGGALDRALVRLERALGLGPWYVVNGPADGQLRPSHLAAQAGYALESAIALRALAQGLVGGDT